MRFFDHQATARRRSRRLMLAFALVSAATVLAPLGVLAGGAWVISLVSGQPFHLPAKVAWPFVGIALFLTLGGWWLEAGVIRQGSERLAQRLGARELRTAHSFAEQRLANIVSEMALSAQMRRPRVMLLPRADEINAFALGLTPKDWLIVVTQGALTHLSRRELQGLVAHECSHLREGDTAFNLQLMGMVGGLAMVHTYGQWMSDTSREDLPLPKLIAIGWLFMALGFVGWLGARLLQAAASREREFLADAHAVQWTRDVDGLGGVLRKVMTQQVTHSVSRANRLPLGDVLWAPMAHLLLVEWEQNASGWRERLASHPSLDERVARLYGDHRDRLPLLPIDERTGEVRTRSSLATGHAA
ncbi:hypothetical protein CCO03_04605 [Comamonas serinivorans]|uniref:Peptidase M48 domain-containing protein n=1 Tax=Comamonas serinivorans TaxID=1082851 RepID=A0A1Y0EKS6_9BURK|nr:M48 family metalloprotease [Comamonas serinivorans]ARU04050.1 hypothetical protein CCO03_04605 [Comamonas serinivorans]